MKNVAHAEHRQQMLHVQKPFGQPMVQYGYILLLPYGLSMQRPTMPLIHGVYGLSDALSAVELMSIYPQFPHMQVIRQRFEQTQFVNDMPDIPMAPSEAINRNFHSTRDRWCDKNEKDRRGSTGIQEEVLIDSDKEPRG